jgi:hypothetical protein
LQVIEGTLHLRPEGWGVARRVRCARIRSQAVSNAEYSREAGIVYAAIGLIKGGQNSGDYSFAADPQEVNALAILNLTLMLMFTQKIDFEIFYEHKFGLLLGRKYNDELSHPKKRLYAQLAILRSQDKYMMRELPTLVRSTPAGREAIVPLWATLK